MRLLSIWLTVAFAAAVWAADLQRVDINNASKEAIETLPGIGPKLAQEIISGRPYRTFSDLDKVKGIGPKKLEQLRGRVAIGQFTPGAAAAQARPATNDVPRLNLNTASQADLEKLPGIGPKRAEAIVAARPIRRVEDLLRIEGIKRAQFDKLKDLVVVR